MATPSQHPHRPIRRPRTVMHDQRMSVLTPREQVELEAGRRSRLIREELELEEALC